MDAKNLAKSLGRAILNLYQQLLTPISGGKAVFIEM
jgi:hypothetical protein